MAEFCEGGRAGARNIVLPGMDSEYMTFIEKWYFHVKIFQQSFAGFAWLTWFHILVISNMIRGSVTRWTTSK